MNNKNLRTNNWRQRIAALAVTGAVAIVPYIGSMPSAQAAPEGFNPVWNQRVRYDANYRDRRGPDRDDRDDVRRGDVRRNDYSGVVQQTFGGDQFSLSLEGGGALRVAPGNGVPCQVGVGDRVSVHGYFTNDDSLFIADNLSVSAPRDHDWGHRR